MQVEKFMASFWRAVKESFYITKLNNDQYKNYAWPAEVRRKLTTSMRNSPKICQLTDCKRKATTKRRPSKIAWLTINGASNISIALTLSFTTTTTTHLLNQTSFKPNNCDTKPLNIKQPLHQLPRTLFIWNALCTPGFFYCKHLLRQTTYTPTFQTKQPLPEAAHHLHQTPFTPHNLHLLHHATFTFETFYSKQLLHQTPLTPNPLHQTSFFSKHPLQQTPFARNNIYTKDLLHQSNFYKAVFAQ